MRRNGNGRLRALAAEMDARFVRMDREFHREIRALASRLDRFERTVRRDIQGLRRNVRLFTNHAVMLDEEFRRHRADKTAHFQPAR